MPTFEIETYKVSSHLERFTGETRPTRVLELTGPELFHGIRNHALFGFSSTFDGIWSSPVAGYLTDGGFAGLSVTGWFPLAEFSYYYDLLRSERPVHVLYEFRDAGVTAGYLRKVGLGTSTEQIGEGPSDSTETLSKAMAARLAAPRRLIPMPTETDLPKQK